MKLNLSVHYNTVPGEMICVCGSVKSLGNWDATKGIRLVYHDGGHWSGDIELPENCKSIEYKYALINDLGDVKWEWGNERKVTLSGVNKSAVYLKDSWRAPTNEEKVMYSSAFSEVIMRPNKNAKGATSKAKKLLQFQMPVPRIGQEYQLCVLGNQKILGNWDKTQPLLLASNNDFPLWSGSINANGLTFPIKYKYGIFDNRKKEVVTLEEGFDRVIEHLPDDEGFLYIAADESFKYPLGNWKGAGVAVPVFSLRSENGFGVGEFNDLIGFIDWAKSVGMKMVQILPVNETIASHNWLDSYPYKAISVMALHPIYMNIHKIGTLKDKKLMKEFAEKQKELNKTTYVDYPEVLRLKSRYYKLIFDQDKAEFFKTEEYKTFFEANKDWLVPYAAFVYLRDKMKNPDFRVWTKYSKYNKKAIEKISQPGSKEWDDIAVHYFIQFHLDKQLKEVTAYARENGIVLKGDIPIGISPNSVEAWTEPHLFNLNAQAGAPPDDFAVKGQNWGFPTYNWQIMAKDDFAWWKKRLRKMAEYIDAYRIDHILGFFRIWEIPTNAVEGVLGYFRLAMPMASNEIEQFGLGFDYDRFVKPYIRRHLLDNIFGSYTDYVINEFLEDLGNGHYCMKKQFDAQIKVNEYFLKDIDEEELDDKNRRIRNGLFDLIANVIFVQTDHDQWHPRIKVHDTTSYAELDDHSKHCLNEIYNHFFYHRHDDFWYHKGMEKLPAIVGASNMLVCGEDLGMVPDCVHPAMDKLNILSLEIQRMPKNPKVKFAHPADAPYLSVCTTSTHDMPTIRGWWEEDRDTIQQFFNNELGNQGEAPPFAEPWVCQQIIEQHIHSPAIWVTIPIQDYISIDGSLRWEKTQEEQINHPSNVRHRWRFRMHQSVDELKKAKAFNKLLKKLVDDSGRSSDY
jgi:4-alpha-glucanotransferase